jgi:AcrR family transcriptional regulator
MNGGSATVARPSRKEILYDFRRRSLLEATRKVIATEGFDAVTMERIARAAGIAKGGIYLYFRNKDEMTFTALEEIAVAMMEEIESRIDPGADPWERLCQLVRAQLDGMERHRDILRTLLLVRWYLSNSSQRKKWQRLLRYRTRHLDRIRAILQEGVAQQRFGPLDPAAAAFYINELTIGTAQRRIMGLSGASLEQDAQGLVRFLEPLVREPKGLQRSEVER